MGRGGLVWKGVVGEPMTCVPRAPTFFELDPKYVPVGLRGF